jgi:hypothetical protein
MQNEPNFQKSQMVVTQVVTTNYNEKPTMDTWSKRTQTNPILPAPMAGKIAPLFRMSFILMGPSSDPMAKEWIPACAGMTKASVKICVICGLEHHRICKYGLEVGFIGDFNVFDFSSQFFCLRPTFTTKKEYLSAGGGGVADEMNAFGWDVGQQAYPEGTFPSDVIAKGTCQKNLLYIVIFEAHR